MNVQIKAPVKGDLFAGGNSVNLAGDVEADAFAAGQSVTINSKIGANAFLAGQSVTVSAPVGGDLFLAGQTVRTDSAATVGGDLQAGGAFVTINGPVKGQARIGATNATIDTTIGGDVTVYGQPSLGSGAKIGGKLVYYNDKDVTLDSSKVSGGIERRVLSNARRYLNGWRFPPQKGP